MRVRQIAVEFDEEKSHSLIEHLQKTCDGPEDAIGVTTTTLLAMMAAAEMPKEVLLVMIDTVWSELEKTNGDIKKDMAELVGNGTMRH